jgi:hypothetical protein
VIKNFVIVRCEKSFLSCVLVSFDDLKLMAWFDDLKLMKNNIGPNKNTFNVLEPPDKIDNRLIKEFHSRTRIWSGNREPLR